MGSGVSSRLQEAKALRAEGNQLYRDGNVAEALSRYSNSLQMIRDISSGKNEKKYFPDMVDSLKGVAALLAAKKDVRAALTTYQECLAVLKEMNAGKLTLDLVVCRYAVGSLLYQIGEADEALPYYCEALEDAAAIKPPLAKEQFDRAALHKTVAAMYQSKNDLRAVVRHTEASLAQLEAHQAVPYSADEAQQLQDVAACHLQLGNQYLQLGDERKAQHHFTRVLAAPGRITEEQLVTVQIQLGMLAKGLHGPQEALRHYADALERHKAAAGNTNSSIVSNLHGTMGILLHEAGQLQSAEEHFRACLTIRQRLAPDSLPVAIAHQSLAGVLVDEGNWADAIPHYEKAADIRSLLAPGTLDLAVVNSSLGALYEQKGSPKMAYDQYSAALKIRRRLAPGTEELAAVACSAGYALALLGKKVEALQQLREAIVFVNAANPIGMVAARVFQTMGGLLRHSKSPLDDATRDEAIDMYSKALGIFEDWQVEAPEDLGRDADPKLMRETVHRALAIASVSQLLSEVMATHDGGVDGAVELLRKAVVECSEKCRVNDPALAAKTLAMTDAMGWMLLKTGRFERAAAAFRLCLAQREQSGDNSVAIPQLRYGLGIAMKGCGNLRGAHEQLSQAMVLSTISSGTVGSEPFTPAVFFVGLAQVETGLGRHLTAYEWLERAQAAALASAPGQENASATLSVRPHPHRQVAVDENPLAAAPLPTSSTLSLLDGDMDREAVSVLAPSPICDVEGRSDMQTKTAVSEVQRLQAACALWRALHASPNLDKHVLPLILACRERIDIRGEFYEDVPIYFVTNRCSTSLATAIETARSPRSPKKRPNLTIKDLADVARSVACALRSLHSMGIAHGSLGPESVLLPTSGADSGSWSLCPPIQHPLSHDGSDPRTVLYSPPEVLHAPTTVAPDDADACPSSSFRADMWAMGCLLLEMADGMFGTSLCPAVAHLAANDVSNCTVGVRVALDAVLAQGRVAGGAELQADTPLGRVLRGCLVADPARRISSFYASLLLSDE